MITADVLYSKSSIGTQILLRHGDSTLLVDAGDGTLRDLTSAHFDFSTLKGILITHEHADHTGGLFSVLHFMKHLPISGPLFIYAPKPILYIRKLVEQPLMYSSIPFEVSIKDVEGGTKILLSPFEIEPFRTEHVDFDSIGYSIKDQEDGYRVVVSGDTTASEELRAKVKGADLAILEATFEDGQESYASTYGHMTISQSKQVGKLAKRMLLVHQMPQDYFAKMTCAVIPPAEKI